MAGRVRDHDNIEEKHVLDILAGFCLKSDSGLYVDTVHMTRLRRRRYNPFVYYGQPEIPGLDLRKKHVFEYRKNGF